jgi:hypothetical protein
MISVIIPTLWKPQIMKDGTLLSKLSNHNLVGEIIIIDNSLSYSSDEIDGKIRKISYGENIYVNSSWNIGVELSNYEKLLILNDDVETNLDIIDLVYEHITEDKGIIGAGVSCWQYKGGMPAINYIPSRQACYGCLMFIHKNSYTMIPEDIKIWHGDDWLFLKSGKANYEITNWKMWGESEQTSGLPEFNEIKENDTKIYNSLK